MAAVFAVPIGAALRAQPEAILFAARCVRHAQDERLANFGPELDELAIVMREIDVVYCFLAVAGVLVARYEREVEHGVERHFGLLETRAARNVQRAANATAHQD